MSHDCALRHRIHVTLRQFITEKKVYVLKIKQWGIVSVLPYFVVYEITSRCINDMMWRYRPDLRWPCTRGLISRCINDMMWRYRPDLRWPCTRGLISRCINDMMWLYRPDLTWPCTRGLTFTWWGCCGLCFWLKPTELAHSLLFCSCVCFCLYGPFNCISFHKFPRQVSAFSLFSSGLISALLVLSTVCLFMTVSFSPDIIPCGWLGLKHQLTN